VFAIAITLLAPDNARLLAQLLKLWPRYYALTMTFAGLMLTALWWHASRHNRLTDPGLDARGIRRQFVPLFLTVALFALSIGVAFLNASLARLSWLLVVPITRYAQSDQYPQITPRPHGVGTGLR
jgi:hypothetical protein